MNNEIALAPFGPDRRAPKGHRWCFACSGSGKEPAKNTEKCGVCKGKGHWNINDIREYHKKHPNLCTQLCGKEHVDPHFK